jgi:hypothetical protein
LLPPQKSSDMQYSNLMCVYLCAVANPARLGLEKRNTRHISVGSPPPIYNVFDQNGKEFANDFSLRPGNHVLPERPLTPNLGLNRPTTRFKSRAKSSSEVVSQLELFIS